VAEALTSDNTNLFVVNKDDNTIVQFIIGNDGKVYAQNTTNTPGIFPMAVAVSGSNLFVVDTYQPLPTCSPAAPCFRVDWRISDQHSHHGPSAEPVPGRPDCER